MGRNSGDQLFFTHVKDDVVTRVEFYCQHHLAFKNSTTFTKLREHLNDDHGLTDLSP